MTTTTEQPRSEKKDQTPPTNTTPTAAVAAAVAPANAETTIRNDRPSLETLQKIDDAIAKRSGRGYAPTTTTTTSCHPRRSGVGSDPGGGGGGGGGGETCDVAKGGQYEYRDHTADVQLHSWGKDLSEALSWCAVAMFGYMTCIGDVDVNEKESDDFGKGVVARGQDLYSLIFAFLDEWLFNFHDTGFIAKEVVVTSIDLEGFCIKSVGRGECFDIDKHPQGTEVKAITYSNMKMIEENGRCDIWVIIDI
mmetsp:Transcript_50440/g.60796  ORF Transcript_50440/g.60796 Transcript_50440/m.60796 type:complete len:250 (-) Transcript_50440:145-894(-)|eukprot:CAMPEP_0172489614 /NCGR_PEP_ID=MMETSP1066-20121228/19739_1 /TAXON_ID=671091 /ORGANISM="Coscinodiscus wailesii, Strain CCMP2513" /LENGTH=249 /DNA_ID=CAMNT_0013257603 /DNA_START=88 /DNA_END=837 /DNA_ORIENTATION=-